MISTPLIVTISCFVLQFYFCVSFLLCFAFFASEIGSLFLLLAHSKDYTFSLRQFCHLIGFTSSCPPPSIPRRVYHLSIDLLPIPLAISANVSRCITEEKSMGVTFRIRLRLRTQRVVKSLSRSNASSGAR